jgi:hypothetical protein
MYVLGLNFGYVSPHYIPEVQKNPHHFWPFKTLQNTYELHVIKF